MHLPTAICAVRDDLVGNVFLLAPWKFARWNLFPASETVLGNWQSSGVVYLTGRAACYLGCSSCHFVLTLSVFMHTSYGG